MSKEILNKLRQTVETMQSHLTGEFNFWYPNAKTYAGLVARIGAKYTIQNICMSINIKNSESVFEIRKYNPMLM